MDTTERILALMDEQNVTAAQLTREVPLTNGVVTQWKQGKQKPSLDAIVKLAKYFNVSTDYLLTGEESKLKLIKNERGTLKMGERYAGKRYVDLEVLRKGLEAFFIGEERYCWGSDFVTDLLKRRMSKIKKLSNETGIDLNDICGFIEIIEDHGFDYVPDEKTLPMFVEFEKMVHMDKYEHEDITKLRLHLKEEHEILIRERETAEIISASNKTDAS